MADDPDSFAWHEVPHSTQVVRARLDPSGVVVEFGRGARYLYQGATQADLDGLVMSPSPGQYVRTALGRYPYTVL